MQLPDRPHLEHLRKQAKARQRERLVPLSAAQHQLALDYGFPSWPRLVRHVSALRLGGIERHLAIADPDALSTMLADDPDAVYRPIDGLVPLLYLLRRSRGSGAEVRTCARLLLDAGADPNSYTREDDEWDFYAVRSAVDRSDVALIRLLVERGADRDDDAMYHACEHGSTEMLEALWKPGADDNVNHKLDFEDLEGVRWFLAKGVDVNRRCCLHHAIARGRGLPIIEAILEAGADIQQPWSYWDVGRLPLALAARSGHLAAYELLAQRGATAELDEVDRTVLAVARGESVTLPRARPPALGNPETDDYGWIIGQFALLDRLEVVRALLDSGWDVDTKGWSGFTPLDQAAMHGRREMVRLLVDRGANLDHRACGDEGPRPLDCVIWGVRMNRAHDGDYPGTAEVLAAAGAPTSHTPPSGDREVDAVLKRHRIW